MPVSQRARFLWGWLAYMFEKTPFIEELKFWPSSHGWEMEISPADNREALRTEVIII
jgi:hypothetical protein